MQSERQSKIAHLALFDLKYMLAASDESVYRQEMRLLAQAIANVLTDEMLTTSDLRIRLITEKDNFRVALGDLTVEGFEFGSSGFQRWLRKIDRWTSERTLTKLEAALRKGVADFRKKEI